MSRALACMSCMCNHAFTCATHGKALSLRRGDVDDLHATVDEDWPSVYIKLERDEPGYCTKADGAGNSITMSSKECKAKFMDDVQTNVGVMFVWSFLMLCGLVTLIFVTNSVTLSMYHGSGSTLKNKIADLTKHSKRLPETQRLKMLLHRKAPPKALTAEQNEQAVLEASDDTDVDPEDKEALAKMKEGDEALHDANLEGAIQCYVTAQTIDPGNKKLKDRVKTARKQLALDMELRRGVDLYNEESIEYEDNAVKIQAAMRGKKERMNLQAKKESAVKIQSMARGKAAKNAVEELREG